MSWCCLSLLAAPTKEYVEYIEEWKSMALLQQADYKIPAAITLAQGLLESGAGQSELAREAKNHFGIKCTSDWMGAVYRHDDETQNECFRLYADAAMSYVDHSKFLQRSRYQRLYELDIRDFEGWAQGLKDCGYATDPLYPQKLMRIINEYRLDTIGFAVPAAETAAGTEAPAAVPGETAHSGAPAGQAATEKGVIVTQPAVIATFVEEAEAEYHEPLSARQEKKDFFALHARQKCNGLRYVVARQGDTYANVAFRLNVKERTLREQNDALGRNLEIGDRIYLSKKKSQAVKDHERIWVHPGETTWMVAQREGITVKHLLLYNELTPDVRVFKTRQVIVLRKQKK